MEKGKSIYTSVVGGRSEIKLHCEFLPPKLLVAFGRQPIRLDQVIVDV